MVAKEEFREDLLYRINTIHVEIPPLRERKEDIVPLAQRFLHKYGALYQKPGLQFSEAAERLLESQPWLNQSKRKFRFRLWKKWNIK